LKGRRLKTYLRFNDFIKIEFIDAKYLVTNYSVGSRAALEWLNSKEKEGFLLRKINSFPAKWLLIEKGKEFATMVASYQKELENLLKHN
jgi:hypothetical protein